MHDVRDGLKPSEIQGLLECATALARRSRSIILSKYPIEADIIYKPGDAGPVTKLDISIERDWTESIRKRYPQHGIVGEETGSSLSECDFTWVLDPIDGTDDLIRQSPLFGSILAVLYKDEPIVGVIDHPCLDILCSAAHKCGAWVNGISISSTHLRNRQLGVAIVMPAYDDFRKLDRCDELVAAIGRVFPNQRIYRNVYGHTMVATGKIAVGMEADVSYWDIAATRLLIEQTGGKFVLFRDTGGGYIDRKFGAIFGWPKLVDMLSSIVNQVDKVG